MKKQFGKAAQEKFGKAERKASRGDVRSLAPDVAPRPDKVDDTPLVGKTENQKRYINAINSFALTFATGPAGTGKTYVAASLAAAALKAGRVEQIILTRPAVEAGENLGFLPGELEDKFDPYMQPFLDVLNRKLGKSYVEYLMKNEKILAVPLAYMRGRTFRDSFVILDEAQNTSTVQMKMFLTRIGENCKVVVNGDVDQQDTAGDSGLTDAIRRCSWIPTVKTVEFTRADIVRSGLVQDIVESYSHMTPISAPL
jgi:phosphate starvation-inducible PhoH-like protein